MKNNLEFASKNFPAEPGEDEQVAPGRYGKKLAEFLAKELSSQGFRVRGLSAQDWGWKVELENSDFPLWIGCGNYEEFQNGFLCFLEPSKPSSRKWFKKFDTRPAVEKLSKAMESALRKPEAGATRIRWWAADER
jgi:hypothetical protein